MKTGRNMATTLVLLAWIVMGIESSVLGQADRSRDETGRAEPGKQSTPVDASTNLLSMIEFGEYSTTNDPSTMMFSAPVWTLSKTTTNITIGASIGFGFRFTVPSSVTGNVMVATVSLIGAFGPPGVVGYEAQMTCPIREVKGRRIGERIFSCGGTMPPRPENCTIRVKFSDCVLEKTFSLSN